MSLLLNVYYPLNSAITKRQFMLGSIELYLGTMYIILSRIIEQTDRPGRTWLNEPKWSHSALCLSDLKTFHPPWYTL